MPIPRAVYQRDYGKAFERARTIVRRRAGGRCEWCGKPDRAEVLVCRRAGGGQFWSRDQEAGWFWCDMQGQRALPAQICSGTHFRQIRVILTCAHIHRPAPDHSLDNLAYLCQYCHNKHDRGKRVANARVTRQTKKDSARPLLGFGVPMSGEGAAQR